jgi:hypothetical protein
MSGGKGPPDTFPCQARLDPGIIHKVSAIIIVDVGVIPDGEVDAEGDYHKQQADSYWPGRGLDFSDFTWNPH